MGAPRRTPLGATPYLQAEWRPYLAMVGIGGSVLLVSGLLYFANLLLTVWRSRGPVPAFPGFAEALSGPEHAPAMLDRWRPWVVLAIVLILIAYGPTVAQLVASTPLESPGVRVW
jgi:cytochrome c oxidase subunit 1